MIVFGSAFFFASRHSSNKDFSNGRFRLASFFAVSSSSPNAVINSIFSLTGVVLTGDVDRDFDFVFVVVKSFDVSRFE